MVRRTLFLANFMVIASLTLGVDGARADALSDMISPVTNPVNFEDPRSETSLRPIFMYHKISNDFVTQGGNVQVWAAQARIKLTDTLSFIATKDGYINLNPDAALDDTDGAANLAAGLKYALYQDADKGQIASVGLRYEWATGDPEVFQGNGDGVLSPMITAATKVGDLNLAGMTQLRFGLDDSMSDFLDVSLHIDYPINSFYPLVEFNMVHVLDAGNTIGLDAEGFDLVNFGSSESDGNTVVTAGVGFRYRVSKWLDTGLAYEFALTDREDIFDWRITSDLIFKCDWGVY